MSLTSHLAIGTQLPSHHSRKIRSHEMIDDLWIHVVVLADEHHGRIVDEHIQSTLLIDDRFDHSGKVLRVGDIEHSGESSAAGCLDLVDQRLALLKRAGRSEDRRSTARKLNRKRATDARSGSRDQNRAPCPFVLSLHDSRS